MSELTKAEADVSSAGKIPPEWRRAAAEAARALSVARVVARAQFPEGDAPDNLIAALAVAVIVRRAADDIVGRL
jgi:deoxyribose-phosphate aldolase